MCGRGDAELPYHGGRGNRRGAGWTPPQLPLTPGTTGHGAWAAAVRGMGFRHTAELLGAWGMRPGFRILDGLWYRPRGMTWLRVDQAYLRDQRERWRDEDGERRAAAEALLDGAGKILGRDPMGLRRVVVHELVLLLQDHPDGISAPAAADLGVDQAEAAEFADAENGGS